MLAFVICQYAQANSQTFSGVGRGIGPHSKAQTYLRPLQDKGERKEARGQPCCLLVRRD